MKATRHIDSRHIHPPQSILHEILQQWEETKEEDQEEIKEEEMEETDPDLDRGSNQIKKQSSPRRPSMITFTKWDQQGMQANV